LKSTDQAGLHWTYHPFVDVGVATLTAFAERVSPEDVTLGDLEKFAKYAERAYFTPALSGYLTVLFTSNFINPSWSPQRKREYVGQVLRSFKAEPNPTLLPCAYCKRPSAILPTSDLAYRDLVPMLTGRGVINFFPSGRSGLPLCGLCTVAIQAIAIGAPMVSGKALIVSSDDPLLTLALTKKWLPETKVRIQLAETTSQKPPNIGRPLTRVVKALLSLETERLQWREDTGLTVFHMSNSGQGPGIEIRELPSNILRFVMRANGVNYRAAWQDIIQRSWEIIETEETKEAKGGKKRKRVKSVNQLERRNFLFEDVFYLPDSAGRFIRTYFLQKPYKTRFVNDPRNSYKGWEDARYIKWNLTELFLKEVVGMEKGRIEAIRKLGDRIADDIVLTNDKGFWRDIYNCQKSYEMRNLLIRQSQKCIRAGREPLIRFEPFLEIFEEGQESVRMDWRLAWDLMLIRVIEQLYDKKWFEQNKEALELEDMSLTKQEV
jgi:CRISPR-associated protein Cst1